MHLRRHRAVALPLGDKGLVHVEANQHRAARRNTHVLERRAVRIEHRAAVRIQADGHGRVIGVHFRRIGQAADHAHVAGGVLNDFRNRRKVIIGKRRIHRQIGQVVGNARDGGNDGVAVFIRLEGNDVKQIAVLAGVEEVRPNLRDLAGREQRFAVLQVERAPIQTDHRRGVVVHLREAIRQIVIPALHDVAGGLNDDALAVAERTDGQKQRQQQRGKPFFHQEDLRFS